MAKNWQLDENEVLELCNYCKYIIEKFGSQYIKYLKCNNEFKDDVMITLHMIKKDRLKLSIILNKLRSLLNDEKYMNTIKREIEHYMVIKRDTLQIYQLLVLAYATTGGIIHKYPEKREEFKVFLQEI